MRRWLKLAAQPRVVQNAAKVALLVGSILALINHGSAIWQLSLSPIAMLQIVATYFVPYCVATYSSVSMLQSQALKEKDSTP